MSGYRQDQQRRNLREGTIERQARTLYQFAAWLQPRTLLQAGETEITEWLDSRGLSARSRYTYLAILHAFYKWAVRTGHMERNPVEEIQRPRLPRLLPRPIRDEDLALALDQADDRMRAWLSLAAYQGFRCFEIANVRREHIRERDDPPKILVENGKGGHQGVLPLAAETESALLRYGLRSGYLFTREDGRPYLPGTISTYGARYLHSLGIEATMHQLRHWFLSRVYDDTKDIRLTQEMARHADVSTTSIYVEFDHTAAAKVIRGIKVRRPPPSLL